jgi:hypothetical protein
MVMEAQQLSERVATQMINFHISSTSVASGTDAMETSVFFALTS